MLERKSDWRVAFSATSLGAPVRCSFLQHLIKTFTFRNVARKRQIRPAASGPVVEGGGIVGHYGFLSVPGAPRESESVTFFSLSTSLMPALPLRVGKVIFATARRLARHRATGERLRLLVDVRNDADGSVVRSRRC